MELTLNNDVQSIIARNQLYFRNLKLNKATEKASTGNRINSAADDAAGIIVSDGLLKEIQGRKQGLNAVQDAANMLKVADGSLQVIGQHILRIRELSIQAANDANTSVERRAITDEINVRLADIDRISLATKNGHVNLLDGTASQFRVQVGADASITSNTILVGDVLRRSTVSALGFTSVNMITAGAGGHYQTGTSARAYLANIDQALANLNERRSQIGAYQNRLEAVVEQSLKAIEGFTVSYSSIKDTDIAEVTSEMVKHNILKQTTMSILAQANTTSRSALQLLAA